MECITLCVKFGTDYVPNYTVSVKIETKNLKKFLTQLGVNPTRMWDKHRSYCGDYFTNSLEGNLGIDVELGCREKSAHAAFMAALNDMIPVSVKTA